MRFSETDIEGCFVVDLEPFSDRRGYFARAWCRSEMADHGVADHVAQINMSRSEDPGTIRGLHWQPPPHAEAKFVRCIAGRVFDVCLDVRSGSRSFGRWVGVELTPDNRKAMAIPAGCAHGYQSLESESEVLYLVSTPYAPGVETGVRWDDPAFAIRWPIADRVIVSEKDASWPDFADEEYS